MMKKILPEKAIGFETKSVESELKRNDSILYCLGTLSFIFHIKRYWI